jgi:hypothetical protein
VSEQLSLLGPNGSPAFTPRCAVCGSDADRPHWPPVPWPCCGECYFVHCVTCRGTGMVHYVCDGPAPRNGAPGRDGGAVVTSYQREDNGDNVVVAACHAVHNGRRCLGFECHPEAETAAR